MESSSSRRQDVQGEADGEQKIDDGPVPVMAGRVQRARLEYRTSGALWLVPVSLDELRMRLKEQFDRFQTAVLGGEVERCLVTQVTVVGISPVFEQETDDCRVAVVSSAMQCRLIILILSRFKNQARDQLSFQKTQSKHRKGGGSALVYGTASGIALT